jgi:SAM-dependent methyltransferase
MKRPGVRTVSYPAEGMFAAVNRARRRCMDHLAPRDHWMSDRKEHWDSVYAGKSPLEVSWYQSAPVPSLKLIGAMELDKDAALIDVGGGASTLVDALVDSGYTAVTVLDVSFRALRHAQARLGARAGSVEWIEADVTDFIPKQHYRLWHDRAVFHFLTDAGDRKRYVTTLKRALQPGGHLVLQTFAVGGPRKCSGLDIVQYDEPRLLDELGADFELLDSGREVHVTPAGNDQEFAWFKLARKPS